MSRVFNAVRRMGSQAHKYQFTLQVEKVQFSKPQSADKFLQDLPDTNQLLKQQQQKSSSKSASNGVGFQYQWTRGPRSVNSTVLMLTADMFNEQSLTAAASPIFPTAALSSPQQLLKKRNSSKGGGISRLDWGAGNQVTLMATLYTDGKTGLIQSKKSKLSLKVAPEGVLENMKTFAVAEIDLAQFAVRPDDPHFKDNADAEKSVAGVKLNLRKCSDPGAYVVLSVKSVLVRGGAALVDESFSNLQSVSAMNTAELSEESSSPRRESALQELASLRIQIKALEKDNEILKGMNNKFILAAEEAKHSAEQEYLQVNEELILKNRVLQEQVQTLDQQLQELQNQVQRASETPSPPAAAEEAENLQQIQDDQSADEGVQESIVADDSAAAEHKISELESHVIALEKQLEDTRSQVIALEKQLGDKDRELKFLLERNVSLVESQSRLEVELQNVHQDRIPSLEKVIEKFKEKYNALEVRYINSKIMLVNAVDDLNSLELENVKLARALGVQPLVMPSEYSSFIQN
eukprot:TRINITY_DN2851_c0_g1_i3.p1 TRINITY_DN2851_c0_g1~~TRINITY_DN2851_c0_g1_i3.p1  ORF type:complete len:521 (-),score=165.65 TRINITY_DN2851_c0_g1_i3:890-2452(-)